jgi:hypothetical protein
MEENIVIGLALFVSAGIVVYDCVALYSRFKKPSLLLINSTPES